MSSDVLLLTYAKNTHLLLMLSEQPYQPKSAISPCHLPQNAFPSSHKRRFGQPFLKILRMPSQLQSRLLSQTWGLGLPSLAFGYGELTYAKNKRFIGALPLATAVQVALSLS